MGANFDGNGQMLRTQPGGGPVLVQAPVAGGNGGIGHEHALCGNTIQAPIGTQPVRPASEPPIRTDVKC